MINGVKIPPSEVELEKAVLGACLLDSDCVHGIVEELTHTAFYKPEHQYVFSAIQSLSEKNEPVDILTVTANLKKEGMLDLAGGPIGIMDLTDRVASGENAEFHAKIIKQKFIQREIIRITGEANNDAYEPTTDPLELLEDLTSQLTETASGVVNNGGASMGDLAKELIEKAELASNGLISGLKTGLTAVDRITKGYQPAQFIILAARTAQGKTSKALQEAYEFGVKQNKKTLFFSLEMTALQLMTRLVSYHTSIPSWKIVEGNLTDDEWGRINSKMQEIIDSNLLIIDNCTTLQEIRNRIISEKRKNDTEIVYVDYLQRVQNKRKGGSREQEVSEISTTLANTAKQLNIPIVALAQVGRDVEKRGGDKKPQLSDLRESSSIEIDANIVIFLYRPEYYGIDTDEEYGSTQGLTYVIIAKNREGGTGEAAIKFHPETTSFSDWEEDSFTAPPPESPPVDYSSPMAPSRQFDLDDEMDDDF